jgi:hypothetical protein
LTTLPKINDGGIDLGHSGGIEIKSVVIDRTETIAVSLGSEKRGNRQEKKDGE